jgi:hypothetical protein
MDLEFDDDQIRVAGTHNRAHSTTELARKTQAEVAKTIPVLRSSANRIQQSTERLKRTDLVISEIDRAYAWR